MFTVIKCLIFLFILASCSHAPKRASEEKDLVTVTTALLQARASYLKGCVDANRALGVVGSFESCVEKSKSHWDELNFIMEQDPEKNLPAQEK